MLPVHDAATTLIRADAGNYFGAVRYRYSHNGLHLSETVYSHGTRIPSHRHDSPSFFMPLAGTFIEGCANQVRQYAASDVSYHPPYEAHWLETQGNARGFAIEIGEAWRSSLAVDTGWDTLPSNMATTSLSWTLARLYGELRARDTARPLVVESLGVDLGVALQDELMRPRRTPPAWLPRIRDMLHATMHATPTLQMLTAEAGVTPVALIKVFKRYEGYTPGGYLRALRLTRARQDLARTQRPISAIALDAGFYDHSHFTRTFRRLAGMTPEQYRGALSR